MEKTRENIFEARTDLALEERESFPGDGGEIWGVELREWEREGGMVRVTEVAVKNEQGAAAMGKPVGTYLTLEAPGLPRKDEEGRKAVTRELACQLRLLLKRDGLWNPRDRMPSVLVAGLGNPDATPDALGPRVLDRLGMTRHLYLESGRESGKETLFPLLSGITPGVMAQTGMETAEILRGIIRETAPSAVLAVDALAARSVHRLGVTIQLSDTGIHPGSGVGNHRNSLTKESLGVPVFALGVPTVVSAAAVVHDTVDAMVAVLEAGASTRQSGTFLERLRPEEQYELIREILEPKFGPMYVTPHDIDERVEMLSGIISEAIHDAFYGDAWTGGRTDGSF